MNVIVLGGGQYEKLFHDKGFNVNPNRESFYNLNEIDFIVFTGGTDVDPKFYGEQRNVKTSISDERRDTLEHHLFNAAIIKNIPMVGICRGAQALCAFSGGKLIQHVNRHTEYHGMQTEDGGDILVSSTHHQMMYPWDIEHKLLGYTLQRSNIHLNGDDEQIIFDRDEMRKDNQIIEPEVVYFPETNALAHQPHPEYMAKNAPYVDYFWKTLKDYLNIKNIGERK